MKSNTKTMKLIKPLLIVNLILFSLNVFGQYTDVINSNRPGVSKSAFSVGTNVAQFEVGPYIVKEKHTPLQYEVSGFGVDFSARYGLLFEQLEINIEGTYQNDTFTDNRSSINFEDNRSNFKNFTLGAKYLVYDPYKNAEEDKPNLYSWKANHKFKWNSLIPAVAVYVGANFDTKSNPYTAPEIEGFSPKVMIATQNNLGHAAIASIRAAHEYQLDILAENIESNHNNYTRFLKLCTASRAKKDSEASALATDNIKTSVVYAQHENLPGSLFKSLAVFALRDIDLLKIESRPLVGSPGKYLFYLDLGGSIQDQSVINALRHLDEVADSVKVLGSYPTGRKVE